MKINRKWILIIGVVVIAGLIIFLRLQYSNRTVTQKPVDVIDLKVFPNLPSKLVADGHTRIPVRVELHDQKGALLQGRNRVMITIDRGGFSDPLIFENGLILSEGKGSFEYIAPNQQGPVELKFNFQMAETKLRLDFLPFALPKIQWKEQQAEVTAVLGEALWQARGSQGWKPVQAAMKLEVGSKIRTGENSWLNLLLFDQSELTLHPNTELLIRVLRVDSRNPALKQCVFIINKGKVLNQVTDYQQPGAKFEIGTESAVAGVRGTVFEVEVTESVGVASGAGLAVVVYKGKVDTQDRKRDRVIAVQTGAVLSLANDGKFKLFKVKQPLPEYPEELKQKQAVTPIPEPSVTPEITSEPTPTMAIIADSTPIPQPRQLNTPVPDTPVPMTPTSTPVPNTPIPIKPTPAPVISDEAKAFIDPILAAIAGKKPSYQDDFSSAKSGWEIGKQHNGEAGKVDDGIMGYADGEYFVEPSSLYYPRTTMCQGGSSKLTQLADFVLEVDGRFVSGEKGSWQFKFRDDYGKAYVINVGMDGNLGIFSFSDGGRKNNNFYGGRTPFLKTGLQSNHLKVIAKGPKIAVFLNDQLAAFITDPQYQKATKKGRIHLWAGNNGKTPLRVQWDNLKIWDISKLKITQTPPSSTPSLAASEDRPPSIFTDDFNRGDSNDLENGWKEEPTNDGISDFRIQNQRLFAPRQKAHGIRLSNRIGKIDHLIFTGKFKRDSQTNGESDGAFFINADSGKTGPGQAAWPMKGLYWGYVPNNIAGNNTPCLGIILGYGDFGGVDEVRVRWIPKANTWYQFEWRIGNLTKSKGNTMELYVWEEGKQQPEKPVATFKEPLELTGEDLIIWTSHDQHDTYWDDIEVKGEV